MARDFGATNPVAQTQDNTALAVLRRTGFGSNATKNPFQDKPRASSPAEEDWSIPLDDD